jgi:hypothetical protein
MKKTVALMASLLALNANAEAIKIVATSTPPECRAGHDCDIYSHHEIYAVNASNAPETVHYMYQLCIDGICDTAQNTVTIYPKQQWLNARDNHVTVRMTEGKHIYYVRTEYSTTKEEHDYTIKAK